LHAARHQGARQASSEVLLFIDDDVELSPGVVDAYAQAFADPMVVLATGPVLPIWLEAQPPKWMFALLHPIDDGWALGALSLLYAGTKTKPIDARLCYGCNFAIRKNTLLACGGFHPDALPDALLHYRGDGESGLAMDVEVCGHRALYIPAARVSHLIPASRLGRRYLKKRAFIQGISDSYAHTRYRSSTTRTTPKRRSATRIDRIQAFFRLVEQRVNQVVDWQRLDSAIVHKSFRHYYRMGYDYHQRLLQTHDGLLDWVLRERYDDIDDLDELRENTTSQRPHFLF
jgi:GT2 family glycosyltransferase